MGDGDGLSLVIRKKRTKTRRYEFRLNGTKDKYHYGNYPQISLVNARKIHLVARELITFGKHPATLLDNPDAMQIIDGYSIKEIEAKAVTAKEAETAQALMTFGEAAEIYKTEHDYCQQNPAALIKAARVGVRNKRPRWLSTPEIKRYLVGDRQ